MERIFIASSFKREFKELLRSVESVVQSFEIVPVVGQDLGGESIAVEVRKLIESCDGLVALMMPVRKLRRGFAPSTFVVQELEQAWAHGKRTIALVDKRVTLDGAHQDCERIPYDRANPLPAFLKLVSTLSKWKRDSGQLVQMALMPESIWEHLDDEAECTFRTFDARGRASGWRRATIVPEIGGKIAYLSGVPRECTVQFRVRVGRVVWSAPAQQPRGVLTLRREARR